MALSADDYLSLLQSLLPKGPAWPRTEDAALTDFLTGLAQELARIDARCDELLENCDPRTASELLSDWERAAGLPDDCWALLASNSTDARRLQLVMRLTARGGQSRAYFIQIAKLLGYENATVTEFPPITCVSDCNAAINEIDSGWPFAWRLNLPTTAVIDMTCRGACTDALRQWGDDVLECVVRKQRPAHTSVYFGYGGV